MAVFAPITGVTAAQDGGLSTGDGEVADHIYLEFDQSGNATVTAEAYNDTSGSWETVVDAKEYEINGSSDDPETVKIDLTEHNSEEYTEYDVTVDGMTTSNVGVETKTVGGGGGIDLAGESDQTLMLYAAVILLGGFVVGAVLS
jgi:spore coat protein CotH